KSCQDSSNKIDWEEKDGEEKSVLHEVYEDGIIEGYAHKGRALPILHKYFHFAGISQTTANDGQIKGVLNLEESCEDVPNKYVQNKGELIVDSPSLLHLPLQGAVNALRDIGAIDLAIVD
ncbi:hypothetical protein KI387_031416, partial [Taxus chinensis]